MTPKAYNWKRYLKREPRTEDEWGRAWIAASDWPTCACGQLDSRIERGCQGAPEDYELHNLGVEFYHAVSDHRWVRSCEIFHKIEAREAELLAEIKT